MNIIERIEERLTENKAGVKTYGAYKTAMAKAEELAAKFEQWNNTNVGMDYMVVQLPSNNRWTVVFNLSAWSAKSRTGTYLGWFAQKGFFSI
jgi:hypothetical protein